MGFFGFATNFYKNLCNATFVYKKNFEISLKSIPADIDGKSRNDL
jgi:hypothetical protein